MLPIENGKVIIECKAIIKKFFLGELSYSQSKYEMKCKCHNDCIMDTMNSILEEASKRCDVKYESLNNNGNKKPRQWTTLEDNRLMSGILLYGDKDWNSISLHVGYGRNRAQCNQRWSRTLNPIIKKDIWTPEEDELLLKLVKKEEVISWTKIAHQIGTRTDVQCRFHYNQLKKKKLIDSPIYEIDIPENRTEKTLFSPLPSLDVVIKNITTGYGPTYPLSITDFLRCFSN